MNVKFGYSLCAPEDTFSRYKAYNIALGMADKGTGNGYPPSIVKDVKKFKERVERYFKGCSNDIVISTMRLNKLEALLKEVKPENKHEAWSL